MPLKPVVEAEGLRRRFGRLQAVDDLGFTVYEGDIFGFLGPNGSGKTTTIRMLLGLIRRDAGTVKFFGSMPSSSLEARSRIGALVEIPQFFLSLSAWKNLQILASYYGPKASGRERIDEVLDLVGLSKRAHDRVGDFSQGMRQRLGIAQAICHKPEFVILDEPTNGLDPAGIAEMRALILDLARSEKITFLISSHLLHEIELTANRVVIISEGRKITEGDIKELLAGDGRIRIEAEPADRAAELLRKVLGVVTAHVALDGSVLVTTRREVRKELVKALVSAGIEIAEVSRHKKTLEDLYIEKTGAAADSGGPQ